MNALKKTLAVVFTILGGLLVFFIGLAAMIWFKPELLLNERRITQALRFAPEGFHASWESFFLGFESDGWSRKNVHFQAGDLCLRMENSFDSCFSRFHLQFTFSIAGLNPAIERISQLEIASRFVRIFPSEEETAAAEGGPLPDLRPPSFHQLLPVPIDLSYVGNIHIDLQNVELQSKDSPPLLASLTVGRKEGPHFEVDAKALQKGGLDAGFTGKLELTNQSLTIDGQGRARTADLRAQSPVRIVWSDTIELKARPDIRMNGQRYRAEIETLLTEELARVQVSSLSLPQFTELARLNISSCSLDSRLNSAEGYPEENRLACSYALRPENKLLPALKGDLSANLSLSPLGQERIALRFDIGQKSADSFMETQIRAEGQAQFDMAAGAVADPTYELTGNFRVPDFQAWKTFWDGTELAVPAPLHVLGGPIQAELNFRQAEENAASGTFQLSSGLRGAGQSLILAANADIQVQDPLGQNTEVNVNSKLTLRDVQLEAPPLSLGAPPQFLPDKRFMTAATGHAELPPEQPAQAETPVNWQLQIAHEQPVRIMTNLLENPIPIGLNLQLGSQGPMQGYFEVLPVPLRVFQRQAQVQRVRVSYEGGSTLGQVDGLITHRTPEVLIRVLVLGSTENPRVDFESDPPLSRQQIISVLLFNKSLAELTDEEASSTQSMSQALSEGAFGLFSLFFLSSTPIQSIAYDPVSQSYSARVGLDDRTTLTVGSDFEDAREFGLRRRLGGRWAISTELRQEQNAPDVVLTLLEWFRRF